MSETVARLKAEVLHLSDEDRLELARALWDSIDGPDVEIDEERAAWIAELDRRSADADAARTNEEPFREAIEELRREKP